MLKERKLISLMNVKAYDNKEELVKDLQAVVDVKDVVLIKASRGMKLEEVITMLK